MRSAITVVTTLGLLFVCVVLTICHLGCTGTSTGTPPPPISVTVSPTSATVPVKGTQKFTATVANDAANKGVTWTVTCLAPPCGSVSPTSTASGVATTYAAPRAEHAGDLTVTITAASVASSSAIADALVTVPGITVLVNPSAATVLVGATQQFTATVTNDTTNSGVTWTLALGGNPCSPGCGTITPAGTASGTPTTYSAPATFPANDLTVTVTATSVALSAASGSALITVPAITASVTPVSALLPGGTAQKFMATVGYDPKKQGVAWTLTQGGTACSPACGLLSLSTTASGSATNYTAPTKIPANPSVTLTATSVTDGTKTATAAITLSTGTVQLVPDSLDFGQVLVNFTSSPQSVTLTNTGGAALSITSITITGANAGNFSQTNTCGSGVGAGMSCAIRVTFKPPTSGSGFGLLSASISIADSSPDSPQLVSLLGTVKGKGFTDMAAARSTLASAGTVAVPLPTGPETVGTRVLQLVDSTRQDPFLANGAKRELLVRFWYPASLTQACKPADYTSTRVWAYFSQLAGGHLPEVITNSCVDAPMTNGVHPMVVFTHGYTGTFTDYTFIAEDLASRGYVVASVDHTYEATAVEFPDGRFVKSRLGSHLGNTWRGDDVTLTFATLVRLQDLRFVVSELERLNIKAGDPFAGRLDVSRIAIAGHSLGGTTAFLALEQDARFRAAIILDGYLPAALIHPTPMPVLVLNTGHMEGSVDHCRLWNSLRGPRVSVNLSGAEHVVPSDAVWLAKGAIQTGSMGPESTVAAIRDHVAAFLDTNLRGRPSDPLLTGPSADDPDAVVVTQGQSLCREP
jgi:dienelactone hydrolase